MTHLLITQGAGNQYGGPARGGPDGGAYAAVVMLGRPEMREFLPGRDHGRLPGAVDGPGGSHEDPPGLDDTPVLLFRDLAVFGEQILLGIRYGAWATVSDPEQAANWARY